MRLIKLIKILTFVLCISTSVLFAQTVPTLEDAVRDQYVNVIDEHELNQFTYRSAFRFGQVKGFTIMPG